MNTKPIVVQKYGGATLATPEKIKSVAQKIYNESKTHQLIIVVSAMGQSTNQLIELANQVSKKPTRREMDMLLTTGERVSMSLLTMALNDLGAKAMSFTGSQAGILTDNSHVNARIVDIKATRLENALRDEKIIILAGFQGVTPDSKEITTLGRGGSDTTAIAMAAYFNADRCEILKDVDAVYTADPKLINHAKPLSHLNYEQLLDMTFWGAKVLHYRCVELAKMRNVKIYIGPAHNSGGHKNGNYGTWVDSGGNVFETNKVLSINTHKKVLHLSFDKTIDLNLVRKELDEAEIPFPQFLQIEFVPNARALVTAPDEIVSALQSHLKNSPNMKIASQIFSSVTLTCTGVVGFDLSNKVLSKISAHNIKIYEVIYNSMSMTLIINSDDLTKTMEVLNDQDIII